MASEPTAKKPKTELRRKDTTHYISMDEEKGKLHPTNGFVNPLLTDLYQITMAYAYWRNGKQDEPSVFDLFFRKNPFNGEFTVFAGLEEVMRFLSTFRFSSDDIERLKIILPSCDSKFFDWLAEQDCSKIKVYALKEGTVCFPKVPLIRVEGPLAIAQLLETTLLCLVNYPSLVATNAARHRLAAGPTKTILEFGLRRAQGPDGAVSASRYTYIGGCNGTSSVLAAALFNIPVKGTHAHAFVSSFLDEEKFKNAKIKSKTAAGTEVDLWELALAARKELNLTGGNTSELKAFVAYALAFPDGFLALVDTYDTLKSGVVNFLVVALALHKAGYRAVGIRLDSGDLSYLSKTARKLFVDTATKLGAGFEYFHKFNIVASNDLNEAILLSLNDQGHEVDTFGIGTNLVTCQAQPALGCVYKLVQISDVPRIKLSNDVGKVTIPGKKTAYRLLGKGGHPLLDLMQSAASPPPKVTQRILCRHPFDGVKRVYVEPDKVEELLGLVWDGKVVMELPSIHDIRDHCMREIGRMRSDHIRFTNPTPYKVSLSEELYNYLHTLWQAEAPVATLV